MTTRYSIVRTDLSPYHQPEFQRREQERLERIEGISYAVDAPDEGELILITNTHTRFDALGDELLNRCGLILHPNSGYDNLPLALVARQQLEVVVGNPIRANAVAAYVLCQLFSHFNPPPHSMEWQSGRRWERRSMDSLRVLLLGFGHIGRIVAASLRPVVAELVIHDPFRGFEIPDLEQRAASVDVVIPLMSLNPTSRNLLSESILSRLPDDFVLINGARGDLIDQACLLDILRRQPRAFAYLDVFAREPFDRHEFEGLENVRLSSHVAGVFTRIDDRIIDFEERVIRDYLTLSPAEFRHSYETLLLRNRIRGDFLI